MSNTFTEGEAFAPQRSLFNALGFTKEEMRKPLVGIVSSYNEIVPGHMNIDKIVDAVKLGVAMAGGTPVVFPAIAVCDGIAMGHVGMKYSLVTRDLIADSTECMALAHQFDALVMVPNCDKNVPGLLMAAARVNVPTVFVSGGPMLAGRVKGCKTSLSSMFEAVGSYAAGKITKEELDEFENKTCPTCGSCSGMYTANSMNCLTEVLGMGLQGNGTIPAVYSERIRLAKHAGMQVMEMYRRNIRPRDIMTEDAILNALTVDMALGCSTNSMLHLPAIAHEVGFDFDISFANEIGYSCIIVLSTRSPISIWKEILTNFPVRKESISASSMSSCRLITVAFGGLISILRFNMEEREVAAEPIIWFIASLIADKCNSPSSPSVLVPSPPIIRSVMTFTSCSLRTRILLPSSPTVYAIRINTQGFSYSCTMSSHVP